MTTIRAALVSVSLVSLVCPALAAAQGSASTTLALPVLGISVAVGGRATWTASAQTIGTSRVDQVTGRLDGQTFTVVIRTGPGGRCSAAINAVRSNAGARVVTNAAYAPPALQDPVVEIPGNDAGFCMPIGDRSVMFMLRPSLLTHAMQEEVRLLALSAMVAGIGSEPVATATPRARPVHGPNAVLRMRTLGLTVPVEAGSTWASDSIMVRGRLYDNVYQSGVAYLLSFSAYQAPEGTTCQAALAVTDGGAAPVIARPPWIDSLWFPTVAVVASGTAHLACLPTRGRVIVAEVTPTRGDEDARRVRTMLGNLRAAAFAQWGAP